jgi:hypothetical protein
MLVQSPGKRPVAEAKANEVRTAFIRSQNREDKLPDNAACQQSTAHKFFRNRSSFKSYKHQLLQHITTRVKQFL